MATLLVGQLEVDQPDAAGMPVVHIFARSSPWYAVYRNTVRVMVHFADAEARARRQREMLVPLAPLRGEISGLIDGWHSSEKQGLRKRAERYDRRVADALTIGLESSVPDAAALLEEVRDDIVADRKATARFYYLGVAGALAATTFLVVALFSLFRFGSTVCSYTPGTANILNGIMGGALGAFFSIATGLRNRTVLTDLQWLDNIFDSLLRMVIGIISAAVLVMLLDSHAVSGFTIDADRVPETKGAGWMLLMVIGFIAGFSERLVPDLLAKASLVSTPTPSGPSKDGAVTTTAVAKAATGAVLPTAISRDNVNRGAEDEEEDDAAGPDKPESAIQPDSPEEEDEEADVSHQPESAATPDNPDAGGDATEGADSATESAVTPDDPDAASRGSNKDG